MSRPVALITGASRGIGRAIAEALSPSHHLLIGGRDAAAVAEVVAACESAEPFVVELTDADAVAAAVADITRLDVVVHSAGVIAYGPLATTDPAEWERVLAVNVIAPATLTRLLLPALRAASGLVVFINSGAGLTASPGWSVYAASKFALTALADSLRAEERGIRVTSVHPGRVATDMQAELHQLEGRDYDPSKYLQPAAVAQVVKTVVDLGTSGVVPSVRVTP
ncbi:MAG: SDR family oxidoreductase [Propionibacteriales bacterium]|nr:SDR family oxidoreductase [Propionibacteriales bacterium]